MKAFGSMKRLSTGAGVVAIFAVVLVTAFAAVPTASAQVYIKVLVNDEPITNYDIAQRAKLLRLSRAGGNVEKKATDELIDETLQMQEAKRRNVAVSESEVDSAFATIAQQSRLSTGQLSQALRQRGVNPETLKRRIRVALTWRSVVQARFRATIKVREQDVVAALQKKADEPKAKSVEANLKQVIFVYPESASNAFKNQRRREAEALRSRFASCDTGLQLVGNLRDVAVKEIGWRTSAEFPAALREELNTTDVGKLTKPSLADKGVEMIAICEKRETNRDTAARAEAQEELLNEEGLILARRYIRDLRQDAVIEYR
ncbi:MAG: SurA N-terminal domain-containing protein [Hyphomicrobiales bacterium]|nr:SurA N-terminal domain-containing protein [Hyphomicrobiales bacterium]